MLRTLPLCLLLLISANVVKADPFVINTGTTVIDGSHLPPTFIFNLSGSGLVVAAISADLQSGSAVTRCTCPQGSLLNLNAGTLIGPSDWSGSPFVSVNGVPYGGSDLFGLMTFISGSVVLPVLPDATTTLVVPFTMTGSIHNTNAIFSVFFTGNGIATFSLERFAPGPGPISWNVRNVTYSFVQTPEPTTILLLTTGLTGLFFRRRLRTRNSLFATGRKPGVNEKDS